MTKQNAVVFGGTGFIGKTIVEKLLKMNYNIIVPTRKPKNHSQKPNLKFVFCDALKQENVSAVIYPKDLVVNSVGIFSETKNQKFSAFHRDIPILIANSAKKIGISRLIHLSSLSINKKDIRFKLSGEKRLIEIFPEATILSPSAVFGPRDSFINVFMHEIKKRSFITLITNKRLAYAKFQPVYVGDIALAVIRAIQINQTKGKIYHLGGPKVYNLKQVIILLQKLIKTRCYCIPLPLQLAMFKAFFLEKLYGDFLYRDIAQLLSIDSVASSNNNGLIDLEIKPRSLEEILPTYLQITLE